MKGYMWIVNIANLFIKKMSVRKGLRDFHHLSVLKVTESVHTQRCIAGSCLIFNLPIVSNLKLHVTQIGEGYLSNQLLFLFF